MSETHTIEVEFDNPPEYTIFTSVLGGRIKSIQFGSVSAVNEAAAAELDSILEVVEGVILGEDSPKAIGLLEQRLIDLRSRL